MKKVFGLLFLWAGLFFFASCTKFDEGTVEPEAQETQDYGEDFWESMRVETLVAEAVWHEDTEQWIRPQNDPFRLENMQQAYDNLVAGKSKIPKVETLDWNEPATKSEGKMTTQAAQAKIPGALRAGVTPKVADEFAKIKAPKKLKATHRVLKVWPKTEEEVEMLEGDLELDVRTQPIDYVAVTGDDAELLKTRMGFGSHVAGDKVLPSEVRYTVTYPESMTTAGPVGPRTVLMPVYYIVWPVGKPYFGGLEYEELWEVFLPGAEEVVKQRKRNYDQALAKANMAPSQQRAMMDARNGLASSTAHVEELSLTSDAVQSLEMEAIELALRWTPTHATPAAEKGKFETQSFVPITGGGAHNGPYTTGAPPPTPPVVITPIQLTITGKLESPDTFLKDKGLHGGYAPLGKLNTHIYLSSNTYFQGLTSNDGTFEVLRTVPNDATVAMAFETQYYHITRRNRADAIRIEAGKVGDHIKTSTNLSIRLDAPTLPLLETHRAASFYYYGKHNIPKHSYQNGVKIEVWTEEIPGENGMFKPGRAGWGGKAFIEIYNDNRKDHNYLLGTVFHELGHFCQFCMKGYEYSNFDRVHDIIEESWAPYVGWSLCETYYESLGWSKPKPGDPEWGRDYTDEAHQTWPNHLLPRKYSPLFVDLRDDFNQFSEWGPWYINEAVSLSYDALNRLGKEVDNLGDLERILKEYLPANTVTNYLNPYK